ncbi:hypothetical protein BH23ACT11_BH23ACT11_21910 [soil metagenome]
MCLTMTHKTRTYEELETIGIPYDVPELGIRAGDMGTIATVYAEGRMLDVEVIREDGQTIGFVDLEVQDTGGLRLVGHSAA